MNQDIFTCMVIYPNDTCASSAAAVAAAIAYDMTVFSFDIGIQELNLRIYSSCWWICWWTLVSWTDMGAIMQHSWKTSWQIRSWLKKWKFQQQFQR